MGRISPSRKFTKTFEIKIPESGNRRLLLIVHITYPCSFHLAWKFCFMIDLIILVDLGGCCKMNFFTQPPPVTTSLYNIWMPPISQHNHAGEGLNKYHNYHYWTSTIQHRLGTVQVWRQHILGQFWPHLPPCQRVSAFGWPSEPPLSASVSICMIPSPLSVSNVTIWRMVFWEHIQQCSNTFESI